LVSGSRESGAAPPGSLILRAVAAVPGLVHRREVIARDGRMTTDQREKWDDRAAPRMKDSRQDRLKSALRENLKRRKSQAKERIKERDKEGRQRDKVTAAPSNHHENALDDDTGSVGGG
jgi:hypothetical protein